MACTLRVQVNLDGYALPIKKLKGTEPVESLDLSGKKLGVASTIVIASLISVNGSLTTINLSGNQLCGVWTDGWGDLHGDYTAEGITAIADALLVNGSLTKMRYVTPQTNLSEFGSDWIHIYIRGAIDTRDCLCTSLAFASLRRPHLRDAALCAPPLCVPARCMCCKGALLSRISCH